MTDKEIESDKVFNALAKASSKTELGTIATLGIISDFLANLDGSYSVAFVRETLTPPEPNPTNEVPSYPIENESELESTNIIDESIGNRADHENPATND